MEQEHGDGWQSAEGPEQCCLSPRSQTVGKPVWLRERPPHAMIRARFPRPTGLEVSGKALALQPLQARSARSSPSQGSVRIPSKAEPPLQGASCADVRCCPPAWSNCCLELWLQADSLGSCLPGLGPNVAQGEYVLNK